MSKQTEQEALRADIEQARGELAETVDALVAKTDIKRKVGDKTEQVRETLVERAQEAKAKANGVVEVARHNPVPVAAAAAVVGALVVVLVRLIGR
ncbi:DUF3618 domain-containing protein [Actinokineospora diospyrosa]|uniref:DUF3618 domain-containing protein n=1 Tax=Actinokineospora diospyrosa TaxID=103728 RepID=A0ABT1IF14_9PSEU|nr:DUF3618 domain-containing protein [Actinokineospora diospyrosa]MCP2271228.1 Protein of unknown function (DUF3618) [Actinokineospora diospyrosa]